ncbi:MAG: hypothetical protein EOO99_00440 [Pedobacter sp.]|nr:MAG: hypothetical protein EOO99_00440 [Pedobacter sp.]
MQFKEIIGQQAVKALLVQNVKENRVSHAQLFLGDEGSGALPLAIAYAQYINCLNKQGSDSCGICASCRKYEKLIHPDLHFSYPFFASKDVKSALAVLPEWRNMVLEDAYFNLSIWQNKLSAEKKQANINRAECHEIIKKMSLKAFEADVKVVIMWLPEYLENDGNVLLKLLEEPPENSLFLLVSQQRDAILPTILSRTQLLKIPKLSDDEIKGYLSQNFSLTDAQIESYGYLADGNLIEAKLMATSSVNSHFQTFTDWLRLGFRNDGLALMNFSEELAGWGRESQKNFLRYGIHFLRECALILNGAEELVKLPPEALEVAKNLSTKVLNTASIEALVSELDKACFHVERNANAKILFLDVSLQIVKIIKFNSLPSGIQYIYN